MTITMKQLEATVLQIAGQEGALLTAHYYHGRWNVSICGSRFDAMEAEGTDLESAILALHTSIILALTK